MKFDVYYPFRNKEGKWVPGVVPTPMEWSDIKTKVLKSADVREKVDRARQGDEEAKRLLPAINFVGQSTGTRAAAAMIPTQLVMIDVDHCENPKAAWEGIMQTMGNGWIASNVMVAHISPRGKGLHIIFKGQGMATLEDNMDWFNERTHLEQYGEYDSSVKDFSRISFAFPVDDLLFENVMLIMNTPIELEPVMENPQFEDASKGGGKQQQKKKGGDEVPELTEEEVKMFEAMEFQGTPVKAIINRYIELTGAPEEGAGEIHNFYNELVKYFRNITSNNKRALLCLLPRFGHSAEECWGQIKSICKVNTLSSLPKEFYFFLKDNGFYKREMTPKFKPLKDYMLNEQGEEFTPPPYLPPVFRELVGTAPTDFILPCVNALLPIVGTLTSYAKAIYPYDMKEHTTSFFSVIYAPPGTGKGFVERFMNLLLQELKLRDYIQGKREGLYQQMMNRRSQNEKAPALPHTSLRIIPAKNSEAEFLEKQRDNHGYHMFTYAAEMDSWAKGAKAAGGNKDDMIRIAWDNGSYGQHFKANNTFKGEVNLFWNVLITGTQQQVERYFKNVENGLVTRCSFCSIENQEFVMAPQWKPLSETAIRTVRQFAERCDRNSYAQPCTIDISEMETEDLTMEEFDQKYDWRFRFRERQLMDCSWIMPTIQAFHKEQIALASLNIDHARDVFRRRVGVRGFRLALMCMCLWEKPNKKQLEKCKEFIWWWMHQDIKCMMNLWGQKYNDQADTTPKLVQRSVYDALADQFDANDVYVVCTKQGIKSPVRNICYNWKKLGYIEQTAKNMYKKIKK